MTTTLIQFCTTYHALICALTVATACLWLEVFCAYRREVRLAEKRRAPGSFVKLSFYLSERLFVHVAYVT